MALVFTRDCAATTGFSTQIWIITNAAELPNEGGNTFIADFVENIDVQWKSDSEFVIQGLGTTRTFKKETVVGGVSITYAP